MSFSYRKRLFLSPASTGETAYILAEAESSQNGSYKFGHYMVTLADCRRKVEFEFFLGNVTARRQSLAKIEVLIRVLTSFRDALLREAGLIVAFETKGKRGRLVRVGKPVNATS
ncbi:MAG TPA: hypothetical protein VI306_17765 [Pyrinomonadaceae bacterium]